MPILATPMLIVHLMQSVLFDNPYITKTQSEFEAKVGAVIFDICLFAAVLIAMGISQKEAEEKAFKARVDEAKKN